MEEPVTVTPKPRVTFIITTPKAGNPHDRGTKVRGYRQLIVQLETDAAAAFERGLRRLQRDKSNRVRVWVLSPGEPPGSERELQIEPAEGADDFGSDADLDVGVLSTQATPLESQQAQLEAVRTEIVRRNEEVARLNADLVQLRSTRAREIAEVASLRAAAMAKTVETMREANEHAEASIRSAWALDKQAQEERAAIIESHAHTLEKIVIARKMGDELLLERGMSDVVGQVKEIAQSVLESPIGQLAAAHISAQVGARVASAFGMAGPDAPSPDVQAKDALRGLAIQGAKHRNLCQIVHELAAASPASIAGQGASLALKIIAGEADAAALADLITASKTEAA